MQIKVNCTWIKLDSTQVKLVGTWINFRLQLVSELWEYLQMQLQLCSACDTICISSPITENKREMLVPAVATESLFCSSTLDILCTNPLQEF